MNLQRIVPALLDWFATNARDLPWRRTQDPYAIWVSEIMLQQTQVKTVIPFWERWMGELPTVQSLAKAKSQKVHKLWEGLGYYARVRNMQKAARLIVTKHDGRFPTAFEDVLELPGIGRYTAGAICSIAFNQPRPILDGNVIRILTRLFGIEGNPKDEAVNAKLWDLAGQLVQTAAANITQNGRSSHSKDQNQSFNRKSQIANRKSHCSHLNQSLMELGAMVCTPRQPRCELCPVRALCVARKQDRIEVLPAFPPRQPQTKRRFVAFVVKRRDRFLVRQRPSGVVNAHLWEFPNFEVLCNDGDPRNAALKVLGTAPSEIEHLCTIRHSITRYQIQLDAVMIPAKETVNSNSQGGRWCSLRALHRLPFSGAHKKILARL